MNSENKKIEEIRNDSALFRMALESDIRSLK
jgi:hypothetical protein